MKLLLIHTGGTIGMVQTGIGFAPAQGVLEAALATLPTPAQISVMPLEPLIDSANATPADWNRIAAAIEAGHAVYDGFIVTHGTDTLAFTAAALCFALAGLNRPVIVTGSMTPLGIAGSDGLANLTDAITAAQTAPAGVWVQFAGALLHGARVRKAHSSNPRAFTAAASTTQPVQAAASLHRTPYLACKLAILTMAPGHAPDVIAHALTACDGVVLRVFGAGTLPETAEIAASLRAAQTRGTLMIAVSQSAEGGVTLGTYAAGNLLRENGVIDGGDMTPEAAYAKLAHVLSLPADRRRAALARALCGEISAFPA